MSKIKQYQFKHKKYDQVIISIQSNTELESWQLLSDIVLDFDAWELIKS